MTDLREAVRNIRSGGTVEGMSLDDDKGILTVLEEGTYVKYKVTGNVRIRVEKIDGTVAAKPAKTPRQPKAPAEKKPLTESVVCSQCGDTFERSKFNSYIDKCPQCRGKTLSATPKVARTVICPMCQKPWTVSKFQPYIDETKPCPECTRKESRARHVQNRKAKKSAAVPQG